MVIKKGFQQFFTLFFLVSIGLPVFLMGAEDECSERDASKKETFQMQGRSEIGLLYPEGAATNAQRAYDERVGQDHYEQMALLNNSLIYPYLSPNLQKSMLVKKFILPSEGAILLALITTFPQLFKAVFCDGILEQGAKRLYKKLDYMIWSSPLVITSHIEEGLEFEDLVLEPEVKRRLLVQTSVIDTMLESNNRTECAGLLFYGPPGTGKTEAARTMVSLLKKKHKFNYMELSGDVLAGASREELRDLIDGLKMHRKFTIVLIDECEKFLIDRRLNLRKGEKLPEGLSEWLNFTSKASKDRLFIYTTNYKEKIEKAMFRRAPSVHFKLPSFEARCSLLANYFNTYFLQDPTYTHFELSSMAEVFNPTYFKSVAERLVYKKVCPETRKAIVKDCFSPAEIQLFIRDVKNFSTALGSNGYPTQEIFEAVLKEFMENKYEEIATEEKQFGAQFALNVKQAIATA